VPGAGVDLHMHTTASDGVLAPAALLAVVAAAGVGLCAVTDHDNVDGLTEADAAARALGITLIPGVELSTDWSGRTLHVLGLGIDPGAAALTALMSELRGTRHERAGLIAARLDAAGAPGTEILAALATTGVVTRTHFARELVRRGYARDPGSAFARWLAKGRPGHARTTWPALATTIEAIRAAGGIAVLAHPLRYTLSAGQRRTLVKEFARLGGTGLEVIVGGQSPAQTETATGLCLRAGLEGSQGSDCHDPSLPWQRPGRLAKLAPAIVPVWHRWQAGLVAAPASTA
jgi:predicted metal-dependent phosphoesterase TrpH